MEGRYDNDGGPVVAARAVPDAWFEERDFRGRPQYVHLDGKRTMRQRPTQGKVYSLLSHPYGMFGPEMAQ